MALEGSFMMASTHSAVSNPADMTTLASETPTIMSASAAPISVGTSVGFIISLCMMEQCLKYSDKKITGIYVYDNYNITKIPTDAFRGATYLELSNSCRTKYIYIYKYMCVCAYETFTPMLQFVSQRFIGLKSNGHCLLVSIIQILIPGLYFKIGPWCSRSSGRRQDQHWDPQRENRSVSHSHWKKITQLSVSSSIISGIVFWI